MQIKDLTRPIIGIENRTAQEVFDIMSDRIRSALVSPSEQAQAVKLIYTNWRGETAERTIIPLRVWYGSTEWHPEPQWLLRAIDTEKNAERDFALKDFGAACPTPAVDVDAKIAPVDIYRILKEADEIGCLDRDHISSLSRKIAALKSTPSEPAEMTVLGPIAGDENPLSTPSEDQP